MFLDRCKSLLRTSSNQFGFKKGISCNHAVYSARNVINDIISSGNTAKVSK